jgi:hypothetical protein
MLYGGCFDLAERMFSDPWVAFLMTDLLVSATVFPAFMFMEGRRLGMRRLWVPFLGVATVGVSLGFPLFLCMREAHIERMKRDGKYRRRSWTSRNCLRGTCRPGSAISR